MSSFPNSFNALTGFYVGHGNAAGSAASAFALDSTGDRIGVRFCCPTTKPIAAVWLFQTAATGTPANISITCELRNQSGTNATVPGTTVHRTVDLGSVGASRWCRWVFPSAYTPAINETVWFNFFAATPAPTVDFPTFRSNVAVFKGHRGFAAEVLTGYTQTASWGSGGTLLQNIPIIVEFDDGSTIGMPCTNAATNAYSNTTTARGGKFPALPYDLPLYAIGNLVGGAWHGVTNGIRIYTADQIPSDTPVAQWTAPNEQTLSAGIGRFVLPTPFTLRGGVSYIVCCVPNANNQRPMVLVTDDWASYSTQFAALRDASLVATPIQANGPGTAWVEQNGWAGIVLEALALPDLGGARLVA